MLCLSNLFFNRKSLLITLLPIDINWLVFCIRGSLKFHQRCCWRSCTTRRRTCRRGIRQLSSPGDFRSDIFYLNSKVWSDYKLKLFQVLDEHTDILYQISAESGGGVVTSREFVILRHWSVKDGTYISSGCSCTHLSAPENKKLIR